MSTVILEDKDITINRFNDGEVGKVAYQVTWKNDRNATTIASIHSSLVFDDIDDALAVVALLKKRKKVN